jgi:hypothetical protein
MTSDSGPEGKFWQIALVISSGNSAPAEAVLAPQRLPRAGFAMVLTLWGSGSVCLCLSNS